MLQLHQALQLPIGLQLSQLQLQQYIATMQQEHHGTVQLQRHIRQLQRCYRNQLQLGVKLQELRNNRPLLHYQILVNKLVLFFSFLHYMQIENIF